jgi:predicted nucleotide-binding protein
LLAALDKVDAAVFVFAPNDLVTIRGHQFDAVRDSVVFELGETAGLFKVAAAANLNNL